MSSRLRITHSRRRHRFLICFSLAPKRLVIPPGRPTRIRPGDQKKGTSGKGGCARRSYRNSLGWVTRTSNHTLSRKTVPTFGSWRLRSMMGVDCSGTDTSFVASKWRMSSSGCGTSGRHERTRSPQCSSAPETRTYHLSRRRCSHFLCWAQIPSFPPRLHHASPPFEPSLHCTITS